jgi:hypothetical protein
MISRSKQVWLVLPVLSASLFVLGHLNHAKNAAIMRADGSQRPAPPLPWTSTISAGAQPVLAADGGQKPSPPLPWRSSSVAIQG